MEIQTRKTGGQGIEIQACKIGSLEPRDRRFKHVRLKVWRPKNGDSGCSELRFGFTWRAVSEEY